MVLLSRGWRKKRDLLLAINEADKLLECWNGTSQLILSRKNLMNCLVIWKNLKGWIWFKKIKWNGLWKLMKTISFFKLCSNKNEGNWWFMRFPSKCLFQKVQLMSRRSNKRGFFLTLLFSCFSMFFSVIRLSILLDYW